MSSLKKLGSEKLSIENEFFKIELGSNGFIKSVYDKVREKSIALEVKVSRNFNENSTTVSRISNRTKWSLYLPFH